MDGGDRWVDIRVDWGGRWVDLWVDWGDRWVDLWVDWGDKWVEWGDRWVDLWVDWGDKWVDWGDRWVDLWVDWEDRWMSEKINGERMDGLVDGWPIGWLSGWMIVSMDGWMGEWMYARSDGWKTCDHSPVYGVLILLHLDLGWNGHHVWLRSGHSRIRGPVVMESRGSDRRLRVLHVVGDAVVAGDATGRRVAHQAFAKVLRLAGIVGHVGRVGVHGVLSHVGMRWKTGVTSTRVGAVAGGATVVVVVHWRGTVVLE